MRYGTNAHGQGSQTESDIEALTEVSGPNEDRGQIIINIASDDGNYLTFAYATRLSDIKQIRRNHDEEGYITASFNNDLTDVAPDVQEVADVDNSLGYSEAFACITSTLASLTGDDDFYIYDSTIAQNFIYWGITTTISGFDEADIEGLSDKIASNTKGRTITPTVGVGEYVLYAFPERLGTVTFSVDGFSGGFQAPEENIVVVNDAGFQEEYKVYRSTNSNLGTPSIVVT